jgi:hypothetical protein
MFRAGPAFPLGVRRSGVGGDERARAAFTLGTAGLCEGNTDTFRLLKDIAFLRERDLELTVLSCSLSGSRIQGAHTTIDAHADDIIASNNSTSPVHSGVPVCIK